MPDGNAAPAGDGEEQGRGGMMGMIINAVLLYFLVTSFMKGGQKSEATAPAPGAAALEGENDFGDMEGGNFPGNPTPADLSSLANEDSDVQKLPGIMGMFVTPPARKVDGPLRVLDQERRARLRQLPSGAVLQNLWQKDEDFDVFVFLSTAAKPTLPNMSDIPEDADALSQGRGVWVEDEDDHEDSVTGEQHYSLWGTIRHGLRKSFVSRMVTGITGAFDTMMAAISGREVPGDATVSAEQTTAAEQVNDEEPTAAPFTALAGADNAEPGAPVLLWQRRGLRYAAGVSSHGALLTNVTLPESVRAHNSSLFAHVILRTRSRPTGRDVHIAYPVVFHRQQRKKAELRSLVGMGGEEAGAEASPRTPQFGIGAGDEDAASDAPAELEDWNDESTGEGGERPVLPHWRPLLRVAAVVDHSAFQAGKWLPQVKDTVHVVPARRGYLPLTLVNDWAMLTSKLVEVNETVTEAPLEVRFDGLSLWYWQIIAQWDTSMAMQSQMGVQKEGDGDLVKGMLLNTNPWLLGITMLVSLLHMVFDFLAFRNDISFWRKTKSMEGLSLKTIMLNAFFQAVILLYLFDNDTSWMVLISSAIGLVIEVWKLRKALSVSVHLEGWIPRIDWEEKETYARSKTKVYDDMAMHHLGAILIPLVIGYALYSLFYDRHKSWYSWALGSLVGFVYSLGFVFQTPQLFINYRLRSVAHLPWRAMVYKSLNTVIDDLFAFIIEMPTMHRLSCFRDDIVFLIFLYQRYIYPVDMRRKNEFGFSGEDLEVAGLRKAGVKRVSKRGKRDRRHTHSAN